MAYNKYKAQKHSIDGYLFDSKKEAQRYSELKLLEKAGQITALKVHPVYKLSIGQKHICNYESDFEYYDSACGDGVIEDCKGYKTPVYRLKKKLMRVIFGVEIKET